jgi:hypothetical protein
MLMEKSGVPGDFLCTSGSHKTSRLVSQDLMDPLALWAGTIIFDRLRGTYPVLIIPPIKLAKNARKASDSPARKSVTIYPLICKNTAILSPI